MGNTIFEQFNGKTDEEFLELLIRSDKEPVIDGVEMPGFPDLKFQKGSVGSKGADDLRHEGYKFSHAVRHYAELCDVEIDQNTTLLDFGVGWGRMIRFFFKDIPSKNLFGIDTSKKMIAKCNDLLPSGNYSSNSPHPPTDFANNMFDIIISYSVFSHLRSDAAEMWIKEFSRILKPNGIVVATTEGSYFLDTLERIKNDPDLAKGNFWYRLLLEGYSGPISEYREKYSAGEFLFAPTGCGTLDNSFYGDAIVPEKHVREVFGKYLNFKYFSEYENLPQIVFVLQKKMPRSKKVFASLIPKLHSLSNMLAKP